ncbi:MAG: LptF/LptG family permease [Verrucomicrobia bacterium]|nr:LptF/LptG family permease [Verrucomicrobiota bacterium]
MHKLNKYLVRDFLTVFAVAMLLITFAFTIGAIYKVIDIMARGISIGVVGRFFLYNIPYSLAYSIPISSLFSTLLIFGRLSSDSEISAMKSSGLSMWQIASPIVLISLVLVGICLYNNCIVYPSTTYANRKLIKGMGVEDPIKLLEEGRFIREFPGYMIYVGKKNKNRVRDLVVYEVDKDTGKVTGSVRASSGIMTADKEKAELKIDLFDVRIEIPDPDFPDDSTKTRYVNARNYPIRLDFNELLGNKNVSKKRKNMTIFELAYRIRNAETENAQLSEHDRRVENSRYLVEVNQRICLSLSPFMFVLIAIPLGITSHRKESSIGMVMSLGIMFIYYLFIILSDTFDSKLYLYPWLIPWIPIVGGQIGGFLLLRRAN